MSKKFVLLPAYNEEASAEKLLRKIGRVAQAEGWDYRIIVCNDGSRDRTGEILHRMARELPIEILTHKVNRGLGETIRDLFERAAELCGPDDVIVRLDCDDSHEPHHIVDMVAKIEEGYDIVTASRFQPGGGQMGLSGYRSFISKGANVFLKLFYPIPGLREYSCGYRAYRGAMLCRAVEFYGNNFVMLKDFGFTCTVEKLVKFKILGARFSEVPFVLRYDQKESDSRMVGSVTTLGYLVMTVCYYWPWGGWKWVYGRQLREQADAAAPVKDAPVNDAVRSTNP